MSRLRGLRWWEFAPEAAVAVGLGFFAATRPDAAAGALDSRKAVALIAAAGVAWLVLRIVLLSTDWPALRLVVFGIGAAVVLGSVVLPAYLNRRVEETLPVVVAGDGAAPPPGAVVTTAPGAEPSTVDPAPPPDATAAAPAGPRLVATAPIHGIDHRASGTAALYATPSGGAIVGLEGIDIEPGPDYDVYVVPGAGREDPAGGTRLDDLRGNQGTQYYEVPAGVAVVPGEWTVLVWCERFAVPVAAATPAPA